MRDLMTMMPKEALAPEMVKKVRDRHNATMKVERQRTLEHIPEWENEETCTQDLQGMMDFLGEWGFDESFLTTVVDHRAMKFIRDMHLRDQRIKNALKKVQTVTNKGKASSSKTAKPAAKPSIGESSKQRGGPTSHRSQLMSVLNK
jgi:hypothetical protein